MFDFLLFDVLLVHNVYLFMFNKGAQSFALVILYRHCHANTPYNRAVLSGKKNPRMYVHATCQVNAMMRFQVIFYAQWVFTIAQHFCNSSTNLNSCAPNMPQTFQVEKIWHLATPRSLMVWSVGRAAVSALFCC